ncbi:hypothetical protein ANO11243_019770 [Dothideomycetidae sp. 11243]|nr:hypothetical protein ANO11243_019770 [fungal sp. No.11243]
MFDTAEDKKLLEVAGNRESRAKDMVGKGTVVGSMRAQEKDDGEAENILHVHNRHDDRAVDHNILVLDIAGLDNHNIPLLVAHLFRTCRQILFLRFSDDACGTRDEWCGLSTPFDVLEAYYQIAVIRCANHWCLGGELSSWKVAENILQVVDVLLSFLKIGLSYQGQRSGRRMTLNGLGRVMHEIVYGGAPRIPSSSYSRDSPRGDEVAEAVLCDGGRDSRLEMYARPERGLQDLDDDGVFRWESVRDGIHGGNRVRSGNRRRDMFYPSLLDGRDVDTGLCGNRSWMGMGER